ncbi:class I SAM-dependent methyltransferase [Reinekea sp.]|jgi:ubiquinone/menaquinone biosynthesis C-methylase UbiE|uniref:class I SAM-dependent methyltransferase n=1 Tax=Reinekea sp. TaxID=1970455 RepID=UPI003989E3A5
MSGSSSNWTTWLLGLVEADIYRAFTQKIHVERDYMKKSDQFWDRIAEKYAKNPVSDQETYQAKLNQTQAILSSSMRILEFGCGTGSTAIQHAPYVKHIDAIDISQNMIEIGRKRAVESHIENITFTRGTLMEFNAPSDSLDAVLGLNVIHLLPDRSSVLEDVARILKPGGFFISSSACLGGSYFRFLKLFAPFGKLLGLMPDVFVFTESKLVDEIKNLGFSIETQWSHGTKGISVFIIARKL